MSWEKGGVLRLQKLDRRRILVAGAGAVLGLAFVQGPHPVADEQVLAGLRASFNEIRALGMQASPVAVLDRVIPEVRRVRTLARTGAAPVRAELMRLASRVAEYTGWMCQEAGDERAALCWTRCAVDYAQAGRDRELASYALVREALITLYRRDATATIDLARRAQAGDAGPRVRGLAARREAQGLALAGERDACERALDRAAELLAAAGAEEPADPVLGPSGTADHAALARGWALCDLGRFTESAVLLDRQLAVIRATARRTRARFGVRRALAHAYAGEIDHACAVLGEVLGDAVLVDSATIRLDLLDLAKTLARWRNHGAVRDILPELRKALRPC